MTDEEMVTAYREAREGLERLSREAEELCLELERLTGRPSTDPQSLTIAEWSARLPEWVTSVRVTVAPAGWSANAAGNRGGVYNEALAYGDTPGQALAQLLREVGP